MSAHAVVGQNELVDATNSWTFAPTVTIPPGVRSLVVLGAPNDRLAVTFEGDRASRKNLETVTFDRLSNIRVFAARTFCDAFVRFVYVPASVEVIEKECFYMTALRHITFAEGSHLAQIGDRAFACTELDRFVVPAGCLSIGKMAFWSDWIAKDNGSSLTELVFEAGAVISQFDNEMAYASGIRCVVVPRSVTRINYSCFSNCKMLQTVTFEDGSMCRVLDRRAFARCTSLGSVIVLPAAVELIDELCFFQCSGLVFIEFAGPGLGSRKIMRSAVQETHVDLGAIPNIEIIN